MKSIIVTLLLLIVLPLHAQITLEHTFQNGWYFDLIEVDSGHYKYVNFNKDDTAIFVFNIDHSLDRALPIPIAARPSFLLTIARGLFTLDTSYAYLLSVPTGLSIYKEDGTLLF